MNSIGISPDISGLKMLKSIHSLGLEPLEDDLAHFTKLSMKINYLATPAAYNVNN